MLFIEICILSSCQHLVRIGLVGNVEYKLILRGLEYISAVRWLLLPCRNSDRNGRRDGSAWSACITYFGRKHGHLLNVQLLHVSGIVDVLDIL